MYFATCCGTPPQPASYLPSLPCFLSLLLSLSLSVSYLTEDGPTAVARGRRGGGERQGSVAAATSRAGLRSSGFSAGASEAAAWIARA